MWMGLSKAFSDGKVQFDLDFILVAQMQDLGTGRGDLTYLELRYLKSDRTIGCVSKSWAKGGSSPLAAILKPLE